MSDRGLETERTRAAEGASAPRRLLFLIAALGLLFALCVPFMIDPMDHRAPLARDGVIDFSAYGRLERPVELKGDWKVTYLTPPAPGATFTASVPGELAERVIAGRRLTPRGAASYHLTLRGLAPGRYTLFVPRTFAAVRVALDGEVMSERGRFGLTPDTSSIIDRAQRLEIVSLGGDVDLRIDLSNYEHRDSGLKSSPVLGLVEPMERWDTVVWVQSLLVVSSLLLLASFAIVVAAARTQERAAIWFALACINLMPLAALVAHDDLLNVLAPWAGYGPVLSFQILTSTAALAFAFAYVRALYPEETPKWGYWALQALNAARFSVYAYAVVRGDMYLLSTTSALSASFRTLGFVGMLGVVIWACIRRREGALVFLLGLGSFVGCLIYNDMVSNASFPAVLGTNLLPLGAVLLLFSQLLILARRWSAAITSAEEKTGELRQLLDVNVAIASEIELQTLLGRIVQVTSQILHADRSSLFLYDERADELWSMVAEGVESREIRFPASAGLAGDAFTRGLAVNVVDAYQDPRFNSAIDQATGYRTRSVLTAPVTTRDGRRLGVMQAFNRLDGKPFADTDVARMTAFAAQAAVAIENATLFAEVAAERNYNDSILRSMSSGVVTLDREAQVAKLNAAACRILGVDPEAAGDPATRDALAGNNPWLVEEIAAVGASGRSKTLLDADLKTVRGDTISANLSIVPLMADEEQAGLLILVEDITEGKRLQGAMRRFMTQKVVDQIMGREDELMFGAACEASILFADIRNFTTLAERLDPRDTVDMLNEIFTDLFEAVAASDGVLDKFIGDAIMAVYGTPLSSGRDPQNAVESAITMVGMIGGINERRRARGLQDVRLGVGVASGEVVAGTIGSPKRMDYTVIGDPVNLASRLEAITKTYQVGILVCEDTAKAVGNTHPLRDLDTIRVRGRSRPARIYQVLTPDSGLSDEALAAYGRGRAALEARRWADAITAFEAALAAAPEDRASALMLERARILARSPPADDWDGVWDGASGG